MMSDVIEMYESVSVHEIERILEFMKQSWLHGFPVVRKEDGRSDKQLHVQAALLLLVVSGCITREQEGDEKILEQVRQDMQKGGRLTRDAMDFLDQARIPERYTRKAVQLRKQHKDKAS